MTDFFLTAEKILEADTTDLQELASIAGYDPRVMYYGASLNGADLRGQDLAFLVGLKVDFEGAILDDEQTAFLESHQELESESTTESTATSIAELRTEIIMNFMTEVGGYPSADEFVLRLVEPLVRRESHLNRQLIDVSYPRFAVTTLAKEWDGFRNTAHQRSFVAALNKCRFTYNEETLGTFQKWMPSTLNARYFGQCYSTQNCTVGFIIKALREMNRYESNKIFGVLNDLLDNLPKLTDKFAIFALNLSPPHRLTLKVLNKLTDDSLIRSRYSLAEYLGNKANTVSDVNDFAGALTDAPHTRETFLNNVLKSQNLTVALAALGVRAKEDFRLRTTELSDIAYHLDGTEVRLKYARLAKVVLQEDDHKFFVHEVEKIAKTRPEKEVVRRQWPSYFSR